jgi:predicted DNA-binding mobile mystery protein A
MRIAIMLDRKTQMAREALDKRFEGIGSPDRYQLPSGGWIRSIREALGMSAAQLAARMGLSRQRIHDLEKGEVHGSVTLGSLRKAAEALDCTLAYTLIPNVTLEAKVEGRARAIALRDLSYIDQTMRLEDQAVPGGLQEDKVRDYVEEHIKEKDLWRER